MDKDILFVLIFLFFFIILFLCLEPKNKENFVNNSKNDDLEDENAFDASINAIAGDENHGISFDDENEKDEPEINNLDKDKKAQVIVFLSKSCPHCVVYDNHKFKRLKGKLEKIAKGKITVKKVYADNDPKSLFDKYDVQFIPTGVVVYDGKKSKISGEISPSNALKTIQKMSK